MSGGNKQSISVELISPLDKNASIIGPETIEYLYFIEDIHSFCITGKIKFTDRIGLAEFGRLTGEEILKISYGNTAEDMNYKVLRMKIQKINKATPFTGNSQGSMVYEMTLVDEFYHSISSNYYSYGWSNKTASDIVKDIMKRFVGIDKFIEFEQSTEVFESFDMHYRSPAECMTWLLNRSSSKKNGTAGFVIHRRNNPNNNDFGFSLVSMETLLNQKAYMPPKATEFSYQFSNPNPDYINKIIEYDINHIDYNSLKQLSGGTVIGFSPKKKKFIKKVMTYQDAIKTYTILGTKTLMPENMLVSSSKTIIDGIYDENMLENVWYNNWIKDYCNQQIVSFTVVGQKQRHAGGLIRVVWSSINVEGDYLNKQYDGKYLIKSITNYFDRSSQSWKQKLVCIKNGYKDSSNPNLIKAEKVNV